MKLFPTAILQNHYIKGSDHGPILLDIPYTNTPLKHSRVSFEAIWLFK